MKKKLGIILSAFLLTLAACGDEGSTGEDTAQENTGVEQEEVNTEDVTAEDGTYEGTGDGFGGPLTVSVTVKDNAIESVEVVEHNETNGLTDETLEEIPERILEHQSYEVETVSGATYTANAVKYAVKNALEDGDITGFNTEVTPEQTDEKISTDVVVIGAGLAGISAAIEANLAGSDVVVLEKLGRVGGNAMVSGGIVYATGSPINEDVDNDVEALVDYYQERANGEADEEHLRYISENSGDTIAWMIENGVEFNEEPSTGGTSLAPRGHNSPDRGAGIIMPLYEKAKELGVEFLKERPVTEIISEDGEVTGVISEGKLGKLTVDADAVIIAAGGFDADAAKRDEFSPHAQGAIQYTSSGNTGDYIEWAEDLGADLYFRDGVVGIRAITENAYLTDDVNLLAWLNTVAVTEEGERFTNESADYPVMFTNMIETGSEDFYWIYDGAMAPELCESAVERNFGFKGETLEELAEEADMDPAILAETVERYNAFEGVTDEDFGKEGIEALGEGPYYAIRVRPATIGTMGGLVVNTESEVLDEAGNPILGLYAAGEAASGQFFDQEYPASGTMLNIATVFGREAGRNAATYVE